MFVGAGRDQTTLSGRAGCGGGVRRPGWLRDHGPAQAHRGQGGVGVARHRRPGSRIAYANGARWRGGGVGRDGLEPRLALAFDPIEGFPERTDAERSGPFVQSTTRPSTGNAAAGVSLMGEHHPRSRHRRSPRTAGCGLCYVSNAAVVMNTTVEGNQIGVQAGDDSAPCSAQLDVLQQRPGRG